jgi:hypothetical protein
VFEQEDDAAFVHWWSKAMLADAFDRMQMCEDKIETIPLPFNHKGRNELFAKYVREALGALLTPFS